jgi:hypothetical protein
VLVCGSVAKGDVVPGWSDLDLLVFYSSSPEPRRMFEAMRTALMPVHEQYPIGLGLDIVALEDFHATHRLGGRPLAMTFEVAQYAMLSFGQNPLEGLVPTLADLEVMHLERSMGIAIEIHNWRRRAVSPHHEMTVAHTATSIIKTLLRILKFDSNPHFVPPFTYQAALDTIARLGLRSSSEFDAYRAAVEIRRDWSQWADNPDLASAANYLQNAIAAFPLRT